MQYREGLTDLQPHVDIHCPGTMSPLKEYMRNRSWYASSKDFLDTSSTSQ